jgi:hypothetical protein
MPNNILGTVSAITVEGELIYCLPYDRDGDCYSVFLGKAIPQAHFGMTRLISVDKDRIVPIPELKDDKAKRQISDIPVGDLLERLQRIADDPYSEVE